MFSLENELQKRLDIVAERNAKLDRKAELENELNLINESLAENDFDEIDAEIIEIKNLLGIKEEVAVEETEETVVEETIVSE